MLEQHQSQWSSTPEVRLEKAEPGDTFTVVQLAPYGIGHVVLRYTVERVLKRDVVCRDAQGREARFNVAKRVSSAFVSDKDPALLAILEDERIRRRKARAADIAERALRKRGADIDDALTEALFAWEKRQADAGDAGKRD